MKVSELDIPRSLASILEEMGYRELYPPQERAFKAGVLKGKSLLLATPTASGKTLVAMVTAAKRIVEEGIKVVYLTPLRALANEKFQEFKALESLGERFKVMITTGDYDSSGSELSKGSLIILTNERFDSLLRHGIDWIDEVKLFVADEVHLVGDPERGATLEMILSKIRWMFDDSQLLALSATVSNYEEIAKWLGAEPIVSDWRPVRLIKGIYSYNSIQYEDGRVKKLEPTDRGPSVDLAVDSLRDGGQTLVFAETRKRAVSISLKASEVVPRFLEDWEREKLDELSEEVMNSWEETELGRILSRVVRCGVAFHHAGLPSVHRRLIEDAFRSGLLKVLSATPTLAAGVNLPARRVVINSVMRYDSSYGGRVPISTLEYTQMIGRAGRPKYDEFGEAILVAGRMRKEELRRYYLNGEVEPLRSSLGTLGRLRTHLLATVASFPGIDEKELFELFSKTLMYMQYPSSRIRFRVGRAMRYLLNHDLILERKGRFVATEFGKRVSTLYIDPVTGVLFREAIERAERGRHQMGILHLICVSPDFQPKFGLRRKDLDEAREFISEFSEEFLIPPSEYLDEFRSVLTLFAWIEEWGEGAIMDRLGVEPGDLHRAVESADWLLYSFGELAKLFKKPWMVEQANEIRARIRYGVKPELLPLVGLKGVGRVRARALYDAGFKGIEELRKASLERLSSIPKIGYATARSIKEQLKPSRRSSRP